MKKRGTANIGKEDESMDIRKIVDLKEFQRIQDLFSRATGLAAIAVDAQGEYISKGSNFTDFCMKYTRGNAEGMIRCSRCDREGKGTYFCHAGLMDFAADLIVDGEKVGAVIGGQVLPEVPDIGKFRQIARELGINEEEYINALKKVPVRSEGMIRASAELFATVMNQWVNLVYYKKINQTKMTVFNDESGKVQAAVKEIKMKTRSLKQTATMEKMLSLNASIEAGRAGRAGVGFSVVAEEIGRMADESSVVYEEIHGLVDSVEHSIEEMSKIDFN